MQREIWIEPEFGLPALFVFNAQGLISSITCNRLPFGVPLPRVNDRIDLIKGNFKFRTVLMDGQNFIG